MAKRQPKKRTVRHPERSELTLEGVPGDWTLFVNGQMTGCFVSQSEAFAAGERKLAEQAERSDA
jgi:hypothetical protein